MKLEETATPAILCTYQSWQPSSQAEDVVALYWQTTWRAGGRWPWLPLQTSGSRTCQPPRDSLLYQSPSAPVAETPAGTPLKSPFCLDEFQTAVLAYRCWPHAEKIQSVYLKLCFISNKDILIWIFKEYRNKNWVAVRDKCPKKCIVQMAYHFKKQYFFPNGRTNGQTN